MLVKRFFLVYGKSFEANTVVSSLCLILPRQERKSAYLKLSLPD